METINLNLIPTGARPVLHASQYDKGRQFRANLFEGSAVYTLTGAETISIAVRKPDGHVVTEGITNTSDSYVIIETTEQMTACAGDSFAEVKIEEGGDLLGTLNLILAVEQSPEAGGDPSESFIYNLETQIAAAVSDQYDSNNVIFDAAPTPGHGVGYAVTSEGVKTALDSKADTSSLAPVATSGDYDDLTNKPNVPEELNDLNDVSITTPTNGQIIVYNNGVWENQANPASTANFAPDYDDTATYNTNDKVIYQGLLYICLEDSVTGAWNSTKWQQISTADYNASNLPISANDITDTKTYIDMGLSGKADTSDLSTVATSGIYNDLLNKPTKEFKTDSVNNALQITFPDNAEKKFIVFGSTINDKTLFGVFYARGSNKNCYCTSLGAYNMAIKAHSSLENTFLINIGTYGGGSIILSTPQEVSITYASY